MSWPWMSVPVALVITAAVVGLPLWQSIWSRDQDEELATPPESDGAGRRGEPDRVGREV